MAGRKQPPAAFWKKTGAGLALPGILSKIVSGLTLLAVLPVLLRLAGGSGNGINVDTPAAAIEADMALGQRVQAPVAPGADVVAGNEFCAALANEDAARRDEFPAKSFYAESLADAIASVA